MSLFPRRRGHLLNFHRPNKLGVEHPLKPESIACLRNLSMYKRPPAKGRYPRSRSAAVLVALFVGRGGDLYALLSRRSDELRSYPGDTSLPGGKLERIDRSIENAARREAFEEIGLPLDKTKVPLLCILEAFLAGNNIIVTPVVVLITDQTLRPILNAYEVQSIFSHPLVSFLTTSPLREPEPQLRGVPLSNLDHAEEHNDLDSSSAAQETPSHPTPTSYPAPQLSSPYLPGTAPRAPARVRAGASTYALKPPERPYHTYKDMAWHGNRVRMHSFLTGRETEGVKPVSGLTAAILIRTAEIGYALEPAFEVRAPGQPSLAERITIAMREDDTLRRACREEGIERYWGLKDEGRGREKEEGEGHATRSRRKDKNASRL